MALLTIMAIYPTLLGVSTLTAFLFHGLPKPILMLFTLLIMVPFMIYFLMTWVTRLFRFWLFPKTPIEKIYKGLSPQFITQILHNKAIIV